MFEFGKGVCDGLTGGRNGVKKGAEVSAAQYEVTEPSEANGNKLTVQFKNKIASAYWIEFKTSLQDTLIVKTMDNTAEACGTAAIKRRYGTPA